MHNNDLRTIYDQMWADGREQIMAGEIQKDPHLHDIPADPRRGLGLFVWPCVATLDAIEQYIYAPLRYILPGQYFYPRDTIHMTYLEIITGNPHRYDPALVPGYSSVFDRFFNTDRSFQVEWRGITCTPAAIVLQGYPITPALNNDRQELRDSIRTAGLYRTERIPLQIAHCSIIRFKAPLLEPSALADAIDSMRDLPIGSDTFHTVRFMQSSWFMTPEMSYSIKDYRL